MLDKVYILISGDGDYGNEKQILGVYSSIAKADLAAKEYKYNVFIEEWVVNLGKGSVIP